MNRVIFLGGVAGLALGTACPYNDLKDHCANADGNAYCDEKYGSERTFCVRGTDACKTEYTDGCNPQRPADDACYSPCGGMKSLPDDPECDAVAEGSSSSGPTTTLNTTEPSTSEPTTETLTTSETEPTSSTTSSGCTMSSECTDPALPLCVDMECVACTASDDGDAECAAKDPGLPVCGADGACIQCTPENALACTGDTPVCDASTSACIGCTYHEHCPGTACDIDSGACFLDEANEGCVVEVDGDGGADYMSIGAALVDNCVVIVHENDGASPYLGALTVDGMKVALLAADGEQPIIQGVGGNPSLTVSGDAVVYVQGLEVRGNTGGLGIEVDGASVWLDRAQVVQNAGGGVVLTGGAEGHVRTSIVGSNGGNNFSPTTGIRVNDSTAHVLYSTLALNQGDAEDSMQCINASGTVRNSIILGTDEDSYSCSGVSATYTAFDQAVGGMGNEDVGPLQASWFDNVAGSVFTLSATGGTVFGDVARWRSADLAAKPPRDANDPAMDIDGAPRPNVDGAADVAGADRP